MVHGVNSGHPGGSLGCADFLTALYFKIMKRKEGFDMNGHEEDVFFLSNGHISPVFYSVLARAVILMLQSWHRSASWIRGCRATPPHTKDCRACAWHRVRSGRA
jgi:transketolase N-terminal domain/subunit